MSIGDAVDQLDGVELSDMIKRRHIGKGHASFSNLYMHPLPCTRAAATAEVLIEPTLPPWPERLPGPVHRTLLAELNAARRIDRTRARGRLPVHTKRVPGLAVAGQSHGMIALRAPSRGASTCRVGVDSTVARREATQRSPHWLACANSETLYRLACDRVNMRVNHRRTGGCYSSSVDS